MCEFGRLLTFSDSPELMVFSTSLDKPIKRLCKMWMSMFNNLEVRFTNLTLDEGPADNRFRKPPATSRNEIR